MLTFAAVGLTIAIAFAILFLVTSKGLSTFIINKGSIVEFFSGVKWNPGVMNDLGKPIIGALPFIIGSFAVTFLSALVCAPVAIGAAVFMTEISPSFGKKILQPVIELLVGIPSVVYGFIGLTVVVPFIRDHLTGSGFGIAAGTVVLSVMILPTITSLSADAIRGVPRQLREASLALGATRWQTIYRVVLKTARPGLLTAVIFGMARAFGEALAVQMVIGNSSVIPHSLFEPASTLTSILTMGMGYTVMGQAENNALWSLALVLLLMSLIFIIAVRMIGKGRKEA
ncbi:phosphate ABC transporter permease subunit PstC [Bacillus sp. FJAT-49731]|uniref:Phosphate transport system permease protein n=2 Tax=Lederbergia citrea TaxID=2833581 RepID=A0A942UKF5_9BACI|nr:phosphate ABC transporter permease subunit PstC [Lederbergia citrea]MBS4205070.1 phosphate ABC transporter permease subunit PstC [Lederbergia citrea]MBS4223075.1 phosphate ABC transporter permease subunit PstC [Lederbergia citrea]